MGNADNYITTSSNGSEKILTSKISEGGGPTRYGSADPQRQPGDKPAPGNQSDL